MRRDSSADKHFNKSNNRRAVRRAERTMPSLDFLIKRLQSTYTEAIEGDYPSQSRIAMVDSALDPCISHPDKVVALMLSRGYPIQVERALELYRMMSRLRVLCEPVGDKVGPYCRLKLIPFEKLTWDQLLDMKGQAFNLCMRASRRLEKGEKFDGLGLLSPEENELYERIKPYFGGRRKPTLKHLARVLIGGEEARISDNTVLNYIAAVKDFGHKHKENLGFDWYFVSGVDSFGSETMTGRQLAIHVQLQVRKAMLANRHHSKLRAQIMGASNLREQAAEVAKFRQQVLEAKSARLRIKTLRSSLPKYPDVLQRALESVGSLIVSAVSGILTGTSMSLQRDSR